MRDQMQANSNLQSIYIYSDINGKFVSNYGETSLSGFFDTGWLNYYRDYKGGNSFSMFPRRHQQLFAASPLAKPL